MISMQYVPGWAYLCEQNMPKAALPTVFPSHEPREHEGKEHNFRDGNEN
jgi:hypothetical protein